MPSMPEIARIKSKVWIVEVDRISKPQYPDAAYGNVAIPREVAVELDTEGYRGQDNPQGIVVCRIGEYRVYELSEIIGYDHF